MPPTDERLELRLQPELKKWLAAEAEGSPDRISAAEVAVRLIVQAAKLPAEWAIVPRRAAGRRIAGRRVGGSGSKKGGEK